jgi:ABC-2 type transport system permease protein
MVKEFLTFDGYSIMTQNISHKRDLTHLAIVIAAIVLINVLSAAWFFRLDLTAEKRFTLAPVTRDYLKNLDKEIMVKIYLTGDLNLGFQKLARATREMLDEIKLAAGSNLRYEIVDPNKVGKAVEALTEYNLEAVPVFES